MPEGRPAIPRALERDVLVEAGHRCAIPTCRQWPVDIEHIDDWSKVKEHKFENLIALCPICHRRKGDKPGQIDRLALRQYKANLAFLHDRYGDLERRLLEDYAERRAKGDLTDEDGDPFNYYQLGPGSQLLLRYLLKDGYLERLEARVPKIGGMALTEYYQFTTAGDEFVDRWVKAQPVDPAADANDDRASTSSETIS